MPTYEYVCEGCGNAWEAVQSIKDNPLKKCPSCGKLKAKRQISAGSGFILKGGGWYSDLYGSAKKTTESTESSTSSSSTSSSTETKSETKTDTPAKTEPTKKKGKGGGKAASSD
jgi:putative FmdB family regulatory protein